MEIIDEETKKSFIRKSIAYISGLIKSIFVFLHKKLSQFENWLLLKISEWGYNAEDKLNERTE